LANIPTFQLEPKRSTAVRLSRVRDAISPELSALIQQQFWRQDLSWFCSELFRKLGYTAYLQEGPGEYGSDIVVEIRSELLPRSLRVGVQVKAYTGAVSLQTFRQDIQQLIDGWDRNKLDYGVLLTTGACGQDCFEYLAEHNDSHTDRQITLMDSSGFGHLLIKAIGRFGSEEE
jgi:Restriction endonuclease